MTELITYTQQSQLPITSGPLPILYKAMVVPIDQLQMTCLYLLILRLYHLSTLVVLEAVSHVLLPAHNILLLRMADQFQ